jgi:hypothetical protein
VPTPDDPMNVSEFLKRLNRLERKLKKPTEVLHANSGRYRDVAAAIARAVVESHRPEEVDVDEWNEQMDRLELMVRSAVFNEGAAHGINVSLGQLVSGGGSEDGAGGETGGGGKPEVADTGLTVEDIEHWVVAGMAGDPKAKEIKDGVDSKADGTPRSPRDIAWRIASYLSGPKDSGTMLDAIREWFTLSPGLSFDEHYPQILAEWVQVLGPMFINDVTEWVRGLEI